MIFILESCIVKGCRQTEALLTEYNQDDEGLWNHIVWAMAKIFKDIATSKEKTLEALLTAFKYVKRYCKKAGLDFLCGSVMFFTNRNQKIFYFYQSVKAIGRQISVQHKEEFFKPQMLNMHVSIGRTHIKTSKNLSLAL